MPPAARRARHRRKRRTRGRKERALRPDRVPRARRPDRAPVPALLVAKTPPFSNRFLPTRSRYKSSSSPRWKIARARVARTPSWPRRRHALVPGAASSTGPTAWARVPSNNGSANGTAPPGSAHARTPASRAHLHREPIPGRAVRWPGRGCAPASRQEGPRGGACARQGLREAAHRERKACAGTRGAWPGPACGRLWFFRLLTATQASELQQPGGGGAAWDERWAS